MTEKTALHKLTPVVIVERIEPVLGFWQALGLQVTVEVPDATADDGRRAFVILAAAGIEVMYQTVASVGDDLEKSAAIKHVLPDRPQQATLYFEVDDLSWVEQRLQSEQAIMPRRTTFYGATEVGYTDGAGNIAIFSQHG